MNAKPHVFKVGQVRIKPFTFELTNCQLIDSPLNEPDKPRTECLRFDCSITVDGEKSGMRFSYDLPPYDKNMRMIVEKMLSAFVHRVIDMSVSKLRVVK